jgi:hypothetical protein
MLCALPVGLLSESWGAAGNHDAGVLDAAKIGAEADGLVKRAGRQIALRAGDDGGAGTEGVDAAQALLEQGAGQALPAVRGARSKR